MYEKDKHSAHQIIFFKMNTDLQKPKITTAMGEQMIVKVIFNFASNRISLSYFKVKG